MVSNKEVLKFIKREAKKLPEDRYEIKEKEVIRGYKVPTGESSWHQVNHERRLHNLWKSTHDLGEIHKYFNRYGYMFKFN